MGRLITIIIAALLIIGLCWWCIGHAAPAIETDIQARSATELGSYAVGNGLAVADGRDVTLTGLVASDNLRDEIGTSVKNLVGVRTVNNDLKVQTLPQPEFELTFERGMAILRGLVPTEGIRDGIVARAGELYGADRVRDELKIGEASNPGWLGQLGGALGAFHGSEQGLLSNGFKIVRNALTLTGTVPQPDIRTAIEDSVRAAVPSDVSIENLITVVGAQQQISGLLELENIEFETNSDQLTAYGRQVLERVRAVLARIGDFKVEVSGHTDSQGDATYNLDLSRRRAQTVINELSTTLPRNSFTRAAEGANKPIADNNTAEGRQKNRRIEFSILEGSN